MERKVHSNNFAIYNPRLRGRQAATAIRLAFGLAVLVSLARNFLTLLSDDWASSSSSRVVIAFAESKEKEKSVLKEQANSLAIVNERVEQLDQVLNQHKQHEKLGVKTTPSNLSNLADPETREHIDSNFDIPQDLSHLQIPDLQGESFSACMLVMDENIRLGEWLAYHYFTLPLRHLVLAVDPRSKTSPLKIVNKWRPFMNITLWWDHDILDSTWLQRAKDLNESSTMDEKRQVHRQRQSQFFHRCTFFLKKQNLTWTSFHDVDEYITFDSHKVKNTEALLREPGSILRFLKEVRSTQPKNKHYQRPCIAIPRTLFGAVESNPGEIRKDVPSFIDPKRFNTLRYRHCADHREEGNGPVKSIVDVSLVPNRWKRLKFEVHRPVKRLCSRFVRESLLTIHHYVGSWEVYSFRDDARRGSDQRSKSNWERKASVSTVKNNDDARQWIQGFVDWIGEPLARYLLQDIGPPVNFTGSDLKWE